MYIEIIIAFLIDILIGDPEYKFHPVRIIGKIIIFFDDKFRYNSSNQKLNGILFGIFIIILPTLFVSLIIYLLSITDNYFLNSILKKAFIIFIIYSSISLRDLHKKGIEIYNLLKMNDIKVARKKLSFIVGRDTKNLNEKEIIRAVIETISENIVDGITSPIFYAFIGGAPISILFKTVSTLDSMVGYKNKKYRDFGWFSAKFDDILNFIPARITALIIAVSFVLIKKSFKKSYKILKRDGEKNPSPNSGLPEAAVAGGLGIQLGGINYYQGKKISKPLIGDKINKLELEYIKESIGIAYISSIIFLSIGILIEIIIKGII